MCRSCARLGLGGRPIPSKDLLCTCQLAVLLAANATLGWSWAHAIAVLMIATVAVRKAMTPGRARTATLQPQLPRCRLKPTWTLVAVGRLGVLRMMT